MWVLTVLKNGNVYLDGKFQKCDVLFDEKIVEIGQDLAGENEIDLDGKFVTPGFVDIHIHGRGGFDVSKNCKEVAEREAKCGVTSFLPTTLTLNYTDTLSALEHIADYIENDNQHGAQALGIYSEGIFFSKAKCGAQNPENIKETIDLEFVQKMINAGRGHLKVMAFAPENKGSDRLTEYLKQKGIRASMGHTNATEQQIKPCLDAGLDGATHLFNGMSGMSHIELGASGVGVFDERLYTEIITDGFHVNPEFINILFKFKPIDKIIFISDNVHLSGLPEGKGEMAGVPVKIEKDKLVVDTDERYSLAGSCLRLCDSIKNVMRMTGKSAEEIIKCATENPARYIGANDTKGYIAKGYDADINIFDKDFLLVDTYVKGKKI